MIKLKMLLTLAVFIKCLFYYTTSLPFLCATPLTVDLPQGKVLGSYDLLKTYRKFLGIPYASIQDRFGPPGKPPSWNDTFKADRGQIKCKQYHTLWKTVVGQEDCQVVNIYTPICQNKNPYPVMIFMHGGGYYWGSNTDLIYNPRYLVQKNVIVVTINYRLGAFGFLCLGHKEAPGNVGIKDVIASLKWVQDNIAYFGGDPNSVTLFGQSVGAASINYLILTNSANGLFHRAILESGSVMMPQAFTYTPVENASLVARRLGYNTSDPKELLDIYKYATADDIVEATYIDPTDNVFAPYSFRPCLETITSESTLITYNPIELLDRSGLNIPLIIGLNDKEGIYWATHYYPITYEKVKNSLQALIPNYLVFNDEADQLTFMGDIEKLYFTNNTAQDGLIDYFTDSLIRFPTQTVSEVLSKNKNRTVYNYYFTYDSIRNINKFLSKLPLVPGADHADELFYLFDPIGYNLLPPTPKDGAFIADMVDLWTSFAKTGVPSFSKASWRPSGDELRFLELGENIGMTTLPYEDRMQFWRKTYNQYGRK